MDFKKLYEICFPSMMALACRFVEESVAKDMVQEAFIALWEKQDQLELNSIHSYLFRSVQNNCLNYIRRQTLFEDYQNRLRIAESRIENISIETEIEEMLEHKDLRAAIEASLSKLPIRCQEAFRLCYFHELTYKEAARVMNISHRTVEVHVQKTLALLKKDLVPVILLLHFNHFF